MARTKPIVVVLGNDCKIVITKQGSCWALKRRSVQKGERRRWVSIGSGTITDEDPVLVTMRMQTLPDTPDSALKAALCVQRGSALYRASQSPAPQENSNVEAAET